MTSRTLNDEATRASLEREFKFVVDPNHELTAVTLDSFVDDVVNRCHPSNDAHRSSPSERVLTATYWDTPELSLLREGKTLRYRTASDDSETGWTLKLLGDTSDALVTRGGRRLPRMRA